MDIKVFIIFVCTLQYVSSGRLLRTPKVYNAVITTDENLRPSRAFPVIQPTIHETGIATYPFGAFHQFRVFNPPVGPFGNPNEGYFRGGPPPNGPFQRGQPLPPEPIQNTIPQGPSGLSGPSGPSGPTAASPEQAPPKVPEGLARPPLLPPNPQNNRDPLPLPPQDERLPIPLNEFGLPPSLIPLQSFPRPDNPINLQPYQYNHYPLIYDGFQQNFPEHYLPPYGYYPPPGFGMFPPKVPKENQPKPEQPDQQTSQPNSSEATEAPVQDQPEQQPEPTPDEQQSQPTTTNFDSIKNSSASQNKEVPDVPPPPLPSGAKTSE